MRGLALACTGLHQGGSSSKPRRSRNITCYSRLSSLTKLRVENSVISDALPDPQNLEGQQRVRRKSEVKSVNRSLLHFGLGPKQAMSVQVHCQILHRDITLARKLTAVSPRYAHCTFRGEAAHLLSLLKKIQEAACNNNMASAQRAQTKRKHDGTTEGRWSSYQSVRTQALPWPLSAGESPRVPPKNLQHQDVASSRQDHATPRSDGGCW